MWEQLLSFPSSVGNFLPMQSRTRLTRHCVLYKTSLLDILEDKEDRLESFYSFPQRGFWDVYYEDQEEG